MAQHKIKPGNVAFDNGRLQAFIVYEASENYLRDFHGHWHPRAECHTLYRHEDYRKRNSFI